MMVTRALLSVQPAGADGLDLLQYLLDTEQTVDSLLRQAVEIENALRQVEGLAGRSKEAIRRCMQLQPQPAPQLPPGF